MLLPKEEQTVSKEEVKEDIKEEAKVEETTPIEEVATEDKGMTQEEAQVILNKYISEVEKADFTSCTCVVSSLDSVDDCTLSVVSFTSTGVVFSVTFFAKLAFASGVKNNAPAINNDTVIIPLFISQHFLIV